MLARRDDLIHWFNLSHSVEQKIRDLAEKAAREAQGMMHLRDYLALGAVCAAVGPELVFEIGTYLGVTAKFILTLVPDIRVISIAYVNPPRILSRKRFNNSELRRRQVGSVVPGRLRDRFTQLFGDSHTLASETLLQRFGRFDLVLIDGDHSRSGVAQDTALARLILQSDGTICWHDANPKERYLDVRRFLEAMPLLALATAEDYTGGIACWNPAIEARLSAEGRPDKG
jgi:predicted O-methyltransferase YrrM